jgi:phytanoyl-CoA hydroxylase
MEETVVAQANTITGDRVESYRKQGFVRIPNLLTPQEVERYREAALAISRREENFNQGSPMIFSQYVNIWTRDEAFRQLTTEPRIAAIARRLAGVPLRIWHDQILIKQPKKSTPTEYHQDGCLWPHQNNRNAISAWIALVDVPVERGCMTFIEGSNHWPDLPPQDLGDPKSLFTIRPEAAFETRVTVPLHAGDCTFHNGYTAHMAGTNTTDVPRIAQVIIYMPANTLYNGSPHPVTDPLHLSVGDPLDGELFPAF